MLKGTPFHTRTAALCEGQNWRRWSGYIVASSYELTHDREYWAIRNSAALLDISPLYKYVISGRDATRLLDRMITRNAAKCAVGQVMYTPWCNPEGKVIDDGTLSRLDENTFRLTSADPSWRWLHDNATGLKDVQIEDVSESLAALALQGPLSREILKPLADEDIRRLKYFRVMPTKLANMPVTISRTGYTGDLGYEVWVDSNRAIALWDALTECGKSYGIVPAGLLALDVARVEAGLLLIEVDYFSAERAMIEAQKSSPLELGLGWAVDFEKDNFVGKKALLAEKARGPAWQFVGLEIDWESLEALFLEVGLPPQVSATTSRTSVPAYVGGQQVGYASSSTWSPLLKKYLALAHLEAPYARPGTPLNIEVTVEHRRKQAAAQVVPLPFFNPERKRRSPTAIG